MAQTTMTPSKPGSPGPERENVWSEVWVSGKDFPAGVPDPAVLARLANEFFTALPEFAPLSSVVSDASFRPPPAPPAIETRVGPQGLAGDTSPTAYPTEAE